MKKILFISNLSPKPKDRTLGIFVHDFAVGFLNNGFQVDVLVPVRIFPDKRIFRSLVTFNLKALFFSIVKWKNSWAGTQKKLEMEGIKYNFYRYSSFPEKNSFLYSFDFIKKYKHVLRKNYLFNDYIMVLGHFIETAPILEFFKNGNPIPKVGLFIHEEADNYVFRNGKNILKEILKYDLDFLFTNSTSNAIKFGDIFSKDIKYFLPGVSSKYLSTFQNKACPSSTFTICNISRFTDGKNQKMLVDLLADLNRQRSFHFKLILAGDNGKTKSDLIKYISKLNLDRYIEITEIKSEADVMKVLDSSDIFIFPSKFESFGIVLLEAAARQVVLIASSGVNSAFDFKAQEGNVIVFENENYQDLLNKTLYVINDFNNIKQLYLRNREIIEGVFLWNKTCSKILQELKLD